LFSFEIMFVPVISWLLFIKYFTCIQISSDIHVFCFSDEGGQVENDSIRRCLLDIAGSLGHPIDMYSIICLSSVYHSNSHTQEEIKVNIIRAFRPGLVLYPE
jgi:hypothetical protein